MKQMWFWGAAAGLLLGVTWAVAQHPVFPVNAPPVIRPVQYTTPSTPQTPQAPSSRGTDAQSQNQNQNQQDNQQNQNQNQNQDNFSQGAESGSSTSSSAAPNMIGDSIGRFVVRPVSVPITFTPVQTTVGICTPFVSTTVTTTRMNALNPFTTNLINPMVPSSPTPTTTAPAITFPLNAPPGTATNTPAPVVLTNPNGPIPPAVALQLLRSGQLSVPQSLVAGNAAVGIPPGSASYLCTNVGPGVVNQLITVNVNVPDFSRGSFKIAENESPRPQDRIFLNYNFFRAEGNVISAGFPTSPDTTVREGTFRKFFIDIHRETAGLEKTFLDGSASVGVRLPVFQSNGAFPVQGRLGDLAFAGQSGSIAGPTNVTTNTGVPVAMGGRNGDDFLQTPTTTTTAQTGTLQTNNVVLSAPSLADTRGAISTDSVGDLSVIFKYAPYVDTATGDAISVGLVVTAPTGQTFGNSAGKHVYATLLQPFVGALFSEGDFFLHGFSSVVFSTETDESTLLFNDIGAGYWVWRDSSCCINGIAPTVEGHFTTPLDHRGFASGGYADLIDVTAGVDFLFHQRDTLAVAVVTPVTGPRPFTIEAVVQFNCRF